MDQIDMEPLLEGLEENIDDLEEALAPLLKAPISATASKLPLLDKAKLHTMTAYAIESILFSAVQLNGVNAKEHPVFTELTRLKQYFAKIKEAEMGPQKRTMTLDKGAAGRFIKHALAGNDQYDAERAERTRKDQTSSHIKFDDTTERLQQEQIAKKRKVDEGDDLVHEEPDTSSESDSEEINFTPPREKAEAEGAEALAQRKGKSKRAKHDEAIQDRSEAQVRNKQSEKVKGTKKKQSPIVKRGQKGGSQMQDPETIVPRKAKLNTAPRGHSEAFQALLNGPIPKHDKKQKKSKSKS